MNSNRESIDFTFFWVTINYEIDYEFFRHCSFKSNFSNIITGNVTYISISFASTIFLPKSLPLSGVFTIKLLMKTEY